MTGPRRKLALDEQEALDLALAVPCPQPPRGCSAAAGEHCKSIVDGGPLGRLLFHHARGKAAGVRWAPTTVDELAARDELSRASADYEARRHYEITGTDLDGYKHGRPWFPDGSHLPQRKRTRW